MEFQSIGSLPSFRKVDFDAENFVSMVLQCVEHVVLLCILLLAWLNVENRGPRVLEVHYFFVKFEVIDVAIFAVFVMEKVASARRVLE